jgi:hypothetical protein
MHDLGELKHILKWHVVRDRKHKMIFVHQAQYASAVLQRFGLEDCKPVLIPVETNKRLQRLSIPRM